MSIVQQCWVVTAATGLTLMVLARLATACSDRDAGLELHERSVGRAAAPRVDRAGAFELPTADGALGVSLDALLRERP